jgi:hypothetical protein
MKQASITIMKQGIGSTAVLLLFTILSTLLFAGPATAQDSVLRKKIFVARLSLNNGSRIEGYLAYLSDTSLSLSPYPIAVQSAGYALRSMRKFSYPDLRELQLHRRKAVGKGILYGAAVGFTGGFLAGIISGNDPDQQIPIPDLFGGTYNLTVRGTTALEKGVFQGIYSMLSGALVGGIFGLLSLRHFLLLGKKDKFIDMKTSVMAGLYHPNTDHP